MILSMMQILIPNKQIFALNEYYNQMTEEDQIKLEKVCSSLSSPRASVTPIETAENFAKVIVELGNKYPNLEFTNPCAG